MQSVSYTHLDVYKRQVKVNAVQCKYVGATVKKVINDFLEGKVFGNAHFFVNSV